jgi:hypothetical protein
VAVAKKSESGTEDLSLALNTKKLLAAAGSPTGESTQIEYHFLSWRELYDKRFITADRYSSGTAEWVLYGDRHFRTPDIEHGATDTAFSWWRSRL